MKSILMKNTVAGIILALIAMTVYGCDQKKKTCEEKDAVTCHIVEKHIPASDVMYLSEVGIYARLHLGGVAYRQDTDLGQLADSRSLYVSFYDTDFHKLGEQMLPERRYSYYTGWCGMNDGILLFVDNALADYDFSEDLYVDKVYPVKTGLKTE